MALQKWIPEWTNIAFGCEETYTRDGCVLHFHSIRNYRDHGEGPQLLYTLRHRDGTIDEFYVPWTFNLAETMQKIVPHINTLVE